MANEKAEEKWAEKVNLEYRWGGKPPEEIEDREIKFQPTEKAQTALNTYFESKISLDPEFCYWYTRKHKEKDKDPFPIRRAESVKCAFSHLTPVIMPHETSIAIRKTRYIRGSYPFVNLSSSFLLSEDEKIKLEAEHALRMSLEDITFLGTGGGVVGESAGHVASLARRFGCRFEDFKILHDCAKYWGGKDTESLAARWRQPDLFSQSEMKNKLAASVIQSIDLEYTLPLGRQVLCYDYPLQMGFGGMIKWCKDKILENSGKVDENQFLFWQASILVIEGVQAWIKNYGKEASRLANIELEPKQKKEYEELAERLNWISENPPRTFKEALQLCWACHIAVLNEDSISGLSPGRLGQILYPYWEKDIEEGRLTREETLEILECLRVRFTEIEVCVSVGTLGLLSGGTFNNIGIGGITEDGGSAETELEELIIEAGMRLPTPQPTLSILYDEKLSEKLLLKGIECNKIGSGYPAWFNNRCAMEYNAVALQEEGVTLKDIRNWSVGGCNQKAPGGGAHYTHTVNSFHNLPKVLEVVLWDGVDPRTNTRVFPPTGSKFETFDELMKVYYAFDDKAMKVLAEATDIGYQAHAVTATTYFLSALTPDCIEKGRDVDHRGSRYNRTFMFEPVGQVTVANALASIKKNVYDDKNFTLDELKEALLANFGYESALTTRQFSMLEQKSMGKIDIEMNEEQKKVASKWDRIFALCINAPKFGNNDPYVDDIYVEVMHHMQALADSIRSSFTGQRWICSSHSVSEHGPFGQACIASADGRLAGVTLSDASQSPYPGTDINGPYALLASASRVDHARFADTLFNMKMHPSAVKGPQGSKKLLDLVRAYMRQGGYHIQFNIVDSRMLKDAQLHPEKYRGLMVRVAGFTQYWVELGKPVQDEIIARTEYESL